MPKSWLSTPLQPGTASAEKTHRARCKPSLRFLPSMRDVFGSVQQALSLVLAATLAVLPALPADPLITRALAPRDEATTALNVATFASPGPRQVGQQIEPENSALRIEVLEGEGSINNIRELIMRSPSVRVVDAAGQPVFGATVTFSTPAMGASAMFVDGGNQAIVITNEKGLARVDGMRPNNIVGSFDIRVVASFNNNRATARITQTNAAPASSGGSSNKGLIILLVIAGGAGAAAAAFASGSSGGGGGSPSPGAPPTQPTPPTITITGGTPTFGPPGP